MRTLNAAELLEVWERGLHQPLIRRILGLLGAACPESSGDALAALSLGQRDARLLQLREWLFGPELALVVSCPACGGQLESTFNIVHIRCEPRCEVDQVAARTQTVDIDGYSLTFRVPASSDLLAIASIAEETSARQVLFARCLLEARAADGNMIDAHHLPEHVVAAVAAQMSLADPQAEIELALTCPACRHGWRAMFDIADFLWQEIHTWAQRTLRDVHRLARSYGWSEAEVLALSPTRRQIYLELSPQ